MAKQSANPIAKQGRPRGVNLNPAAVLDLLSIRTMSKQSLAEAARMTPGNLSDALTRQKGVSVEKVGLMAVALRCSAETIAPSLSTLFAALREGDTEVAA